MSPAKLGSLIGAAFGLLFVLLNTGGLPGVAATGLRAGAGLVFLAVLLAAFAHGGKDVHPPSGPAPQGGFGRGYWAVVAGEAVALWGGLAVLNGPLDTPDAGVAWVSFVVGAHFLGLAVVWRQRVFVGLAVVLSACGLAGLGLAALGSRQQAVEVVGGVVPGAVLLAVAGWTTARANGWGGAGSAAGTGPRPPASRGMRR
ncbi:hypothetical protein [Motilibacter aurantiacus]|uniref:hypothetical protein n=1 Tax=Motilibacter aurantiacus TaxID=2714955 RepID=UPI00140CB633|nr:hypothetical protein [Motilibacter aurantiacus]NHC43914.1 hypothetical protein [Motilibacter aurantiacus]